MRASDLDILEHEIHMFVISNELCIKFCAISKPDIHILANALFEEIKRLFIVVHDINLNNIASYDWNRYLDFILSAYIIKYKIPMAAYFAIKAYCIYTTTLFFREI